MVKYQGIFFEGEAADLIRSAEGVHLPVVNDEYHCTFKYRPSDAEIFDAVAGKEIEVLLVGYACDGKNSGFEIVLPFDVEKYYTNYDSEGMLKTPHITTSLTPDARAVDTANLNFRPLPKPIAVTGRFGYWVEKDDMKFISYEPYKKAKTI